MAGGPNISRLFADPLCKRSWNEFLHANFSLCKACVSIRVPDDGNECNCKLCGAPSDRHGVGTVEGFHLSWEVTFVHCRLTLLELGTNLRFSQISSVELEQGKDGTTVGVIRTIRWRSGEVKKQRLLAVSDQYHYSSWELVESEPAEEVTAVNSPFSCRCSFPEFVLLRRFLQPFVVSASPNIIIP